MNKEELAKISKLGWLVWIIALLLLFHLIFGWFDNSSSNDELQSQVDDLQFQVDDMQSQIDDLQTHVDNIQIDLGRTWSNLNEEKNLFRAYPSVSGCSSC